MDLCVMIEGQEDVTWEQWRAIAQACEEHGIPALFRSDHYLPLGGRLERGVLDAWGTICALAAVTDKLRLGTLVSPATFRHPSQLAKLAVTADHMSGGRIEFGLGAGWHEGEHAAYGFPFADLKTRMDVFAEQLEIVRGLWGEGEYSFSGEHYTLSGVDARPKPLQRPHPPVIVGGLAKPRSVALAARWATEYNTIFATPEECRERRARVPDSLRFSLMTPCLIGRDGAEIERRRAALAERGAKPDGPWLIGTPDEVVAQLREYEAAGVDRIMFQLLLHDDLEQIELIGRELAPAVRG